MATNSLYLVFAKSAESNTSINPRFGMIINAIQWFLQKYHIWFLSHLFKRSAYYTKCLRLHLLKVVWCPYDIPVLPPLHLKRYVDTNCPNDFSVGLISHIIYFLAHFTVFKIIVVIIPQHWPVMALLTNSYRFKEQNLLIYLIHLLL